jgi:Holliday junction resolvase RusA-like endonuclease
MDARYAVTITMHEPDRRSRDLDNAKAIMDGLSGIAWNDDRQVDAYTVTRGEVRRLAPCVVVTVQTMDAKGAARA